MKQVKYPLQILAGLLILCGASGLRAAEADPVDRLVEDQMRQHKIPGVSIALVRGGKTIKARGYGFSDLELRTPATEATVYEIGSLTKQFTAVLILMLSAEGNLGLDEKIGRYFEVPAAWQNITVRHLLNHTSGLKNYTGLPGFEANRKRSAGEFIKTLSRYPLEKQPGEEFRYCNSGYNLLGYLLEKQSGVAYWKLLHARILRPLKMESTGDRNAPGIARAAGYEWKNGQWVSRDPHLTDVFSAGAMVSSVLDLVKWDAALETETLLRKAQREIMFMPAKLKTGGSYPYGFGWRLEDDKQHRNIGHSGSTAGFSSSLQKYPNDQLTVIVLCNTSGQGVATLLARSIAEVYLPR